MNESTILSLLKGLCIALAFLGLFAIYESVNHKSPTQLCNDLEEFPENCYPEFVVSYPKERKGEVTCICIEYAFLGDDYEYLEVNQKKGNI